MMKEKIIIRNLEKREISKIVKLVRSSFDNKYLKTSIYETDGIENFIKNELENPFSPYHYFVAEYESDIIGFAEFKIFEETKTAFLNIIATSNISKGQGVSTKLFNNCVEFFSKKGYDNMQLDVFESNQIAKQWYENLGFKETSKSFFYKIELEKEKYDENASTNFFLLNYNQFKVQYNEFKFSFLNLFVEKNINVGIINNKGILKGDKSILTNIHTIERILKKFHIEEIYYFGGEKVFEFVEIDEVKRMKINLSKNGNN